MRKVALLTCLTLLTFPAVADVLTCDALKARVDAKLQSKGVKTYTLEIVSIADPKNITGAASAVPTTNTVKGKEVGTCDGGTKRLMYTRGN
jgi:hypothetical protein